MTDCICWYSQGLCTAHPSNAPRPTPPEPDEAERADLARLRAQLAEAREVLRSVEWHGCVHHDGNSYPACLVCGEYHPDHAPDCRLAAVLENS